MRNFFCDCGQRLFFENTSCHSCGSKVGFFPNELNLVTLNSRPDLKPCANREPHAVCNWVTSAEDPQSLCRACRLNEVIPNLTQPENALLWTRLETAKRRMLYSLLCLDLPFEANEPGGRSLRFRFLEDQRRNPEVLEPFVMTGHIAGTITINLAEADDAERHAVREQMQERYRTLLGHFRHEVGHYFFPSLVVEADLLEDFRVSFGDERQDYVQAIDKHYQTQAGSDWHANYVSAYASAHPHEDWAETFAHYLHITDALETAEAAGLVTSAEDIETGAIRRWMSLAVTLNELNRSLGIDDPYPFVLTQPVVRKLELVNRLVRR